MEKRKKTLLILGLCIFTLTLIGLSYAFWQITLQQTDENEIATACLDIELMPNEGTGITLNPAYPILDDEAKTLTPYTFTIHNKCEDNLRYQINVEVLDDTTLDSKYIKVKLNEENKKGKISKFTSKQQVTPTLTKEPTIADEAYKIETGYLTSNATKSFEFRQWMDGNIKGTDTESMNKIFKSKITITATYVSEIPETFVFPDSIIGQIDEQGNGLIEQEHGEDEQFQEGDEKFRDTELRYVGVNPNNYVWFNCDDGTTSGEENCELWRIIGLVNVKTETGITQRVKIIREESIGEYSWDTSAENINQGRGINEWSQSDVMKLLNPGYEDNKDLNNSGENVKVNNSLYWNRQNGTCYSGRDNRTISCDFTTSGMKSETQKYISDDIIWNIGTNGENDYTDNTKGLQKHFYSYERSSNDGKICQNNEKNCNDEVSRTTEWKTEGNKKALVGLMYPSDYGYAVGGIGENRNECLKTGMRDWYAEDQEDTKCADNDWLKIYSKLSSYEEAQHTITPEASTSYNSDVFAVFKGGHVTDYPANYSESIRPVIYLKEDVIIEVDEDSENTNLNGSETHPFILSLNE